MIIQVLSKRIDEADQCRANNMNGFKGCIVGCLALKSREIAAFPTSWRIFQVVHILIRIDVLRLDILNLRRQDVSQSDHRVIKK